MIYRKDPLHLRYEESTKTNEKHINFNIVFTQMGSFVKQHNCSKFWGGTCQIEGKFSEHNSN
jgi:hypothetical protein